MKCGIYYMYWWKIVSGRDNWRLRTECVIQCQPNTVSIDFYQLTERPHTCLYITNTMWRPATSKTLYSSLFNRIGNKY